MFEQLSAREQPVYESDHADLQNCKNNKEEMREKWKEYIKKETENEQKKKDNLHKK